MMSCSVFESIVGRFPTARVGVVGDLMLDRYLWGSASRISQEAPVPVVRVVNETQSPGGAANVIANIRSLGGGAFAYGVVGCDDHGDCLARMLRDCGAALAGVERLPSRPTTVKTRVIANHQQVVRIDYEETAQIGGEVLDRLAARLTADIVADRLDAVIFEDYAKGMLTAEFVQPIVAAARGKGVITALDPHPSHTFNTQGLSLLTPNRAEAFGLAATYFQPGVLPMADDHALMAVGGALQAEWAVEHLLITLGADGMALFSPGVEPLHIPTRAQDVYDVSGAGDTVTASFVLALIAGATPQQAAVISNHAAGIVVGKVGTVPVDVDELRQDLGSEHA